MCGSPTHATPDHRQGSRCATRDHERLCAAAARPASGTLPSAGLLQAQPFGSPEIRAGSRAQQAVPALRHPSMRRRPRLETCARLLGLPSPGSISQRGALLTSRRAYAGVPSSVYHGGTRQTGTVTVRIRSPGSVAGQRTHPIAAHLGQGGSTRSLGAGHTTQI